ncbi:MAG: divergent polysaccharide deacetylase family protein [Alphaproteobacteria bacterium]|nr:divergent polysaccharide deacetylase family protein [Alphaproteobacteria bacterium]
MKSLLWLCVVIVLSIVLYERIQPMHVYKKAVVSVDVPAVLMDTAPRPQEVVSSASVVKDIEPAMPVQDRQPLAIIYPQKVAPDNALQVYKKPYTIVGHLPMVSVIVAGLGLQADMTQRALAVLPDVVSLSFSYGADNVSNWILQARQKGFETLFDMPVQSDAFPLVDKGKYLISPLTKSWENSAQVEDLLVQNSAVIGFVAPDSMYMDDLPAYQQFVQDTLAPRGLIYVGRKAMSPEQPAIDLYFNGPFEPKTLDAFLDKVLQTAESNGRAVAVVPANALILSRLQQWMSVQDADVEFVPVSALFADAEK